MPNSGAISIGCPAAVTTPERAIARADWVIEGKIRVIAFDKNFSATDVVLEETKIVRESGRSHAGKTVVLRMESCSYPGSKAFEGKAAGKLEGTRMRFFGNKHVTSPIRRFFFAQSAGSPMPVAVENSPWGRQPMATTVHRDKAESPLDGGWHRGHSTRGGFSIDLPGTFADVTRVEDNQPAYMLRATDQYGSAFIAVFERSGPDANLTGTFDNEIERAGALVSTFKGLPAVSSRGELTNDGQEMISHSLFFRVPGGTYMLGIVGKRNMKCNR